MTGTNNAATSRRNTGPPRYAYPPETIRAARQRAHLTQRELAERVGGGARSVVRWETEGVLEGSRKLGALEEVLGLGAHADPAPPNAADGGSSPHPAVRAVDLTPMDVVSVLAGMLAELQALRASTATPELPGDLYRWNEADAPTIRRGGLGHTQAAVSQSDLA